MSGYCGRIIRINLNNNKIDIEEKDDAFYRRYIGGKGIIAYYLLKELPLNINPLQSENLLIFAAGVLTGAPVAGMSRFAVGAKSPLTGGYGQAEAGGFWGPELKKAGYDAVIVEGKAEKPVYIYIRDELIEIREASHLWGKETGEAQELIRKELGEQSVRIAQIGPGGENLVRYACIINELKHVNGRTGMGAVMGSKNLKAIAVKGSKEIPFADDKKVIEIGKLFIDKYLEHPMIKGFTDYGTIASVKGSDAGGILPTRNFIYGEFRDSEKINADSYNNNILKKKHGCYACAVQCKRIVEVDNGEVSVDPRYGGPEYETVAAFGSLCENNDLYTIAKANELCNRYAIDTISTGATIAFAMECYEKGILTEKDLDGIKLNFGNGKAILELIHKIAKREGIGNTLAEGSARVARKLGPEAQKICMCVKNQELPMHEPRGKVGVGIGYAVCETGADHMVIGHDTLMQQRGITFDSMAQMGFIEPLDALDLSSKKVRMFTYLQYWWSFFNMAGICDFTVVPRGALPIEDLLTLLKATTGWDTSLWEALKAGERTVNMTRCFNLKEGFTAEDDVLPSRLHEPLKNGRLKGQSISEKEFAEAISSYYSIMGWNDNGVPSAGKLAELELDWLVGRNK